MTKAHLTKTYRVCGRCIMDTSDPDIRFDATGNCNHCANALRRMSRQLLPPPERERALQALAEQIKTEGKAKEYDCIIGVSGGVDSTTTAFWVKKLGLRPLAVHFDNGWDSELAVDNIRGTLQALGIDLYTHVVDWEEFRDIQIAFLKASVPNCEIPTDHGITALLFRTAARHGVRYILSGSNLATESIMPSAWVYFNQDLRHLKAIHDRFGTKALSTMPAISLGRYLRSVFMLRLRQIPFLNYIVYDRDDAKRQLNRGFGWRDYGGKHYESVWTRFFQGYYLPKKFGFDKRRAHYSSMVCSGLMTRDAALAEMDKPVYPPDLLSQDMQFVIKKFGLTEGEWQDMLHAPPQRHEAYPGHHFLLKRLSPLRNAFRSIATKK